jgi:hypothetical protein
MKSKHGIELQRKHLLFYAMYLSHWQRYLVGIAVHDCHTKRVTFYAPWFPQFSGFIEVFMSIILFV